MQMHTDDPVYKVDNVFLGPRHYALPWQARYPAYGIGVLVEGTQILALKIVGLLSFWPIVFSLILTVHLTVRAMRLIDHERTVTSAATVLWHEISAPRKRRPGAAVRASLSLSAVRQHHD